jgi:hypothetical protein
MDLDLRPTRQGRDDAMKIRLTTKEKRAIWRAAAAAKVEASVWARAVLLREAEKGA